MAQRSRTLRRGKTSRLPGAEEEDLLQPHAESAEQQQQRGAAHREQRCEGRVSTLATVGGAASRLGKAWDERTHVWTKDIAVFQYICKYSINASTFM